MPKQTTPSCRKYKKSECSSDKECIWLTGRGCLSEYDVPLATLAQKKSMPVKKQVVEKSSKAVPCNKLRKDTCNTTEDCIWVPGKGCKNEDTIPLAILARLRKESDINKKQSTPVKKTEKDAKKTKKGEINIPKIKYILKAKTPKEKEKIVKAMAQGFIDAIKEERKRLGGKGKVLQHIKDKLMDLNTDCLEYDDLTYENYLQGLDNIRYDLYRTENKKYGLDMNLEVIDDVIEKYTEKVHQLREEHRA